MQPLEDDYRHFFEQSLDLFCIAGFDGHFRLLNPQWERLLGHSAAELMARPYLDFVHEEDIAVTAVEARKLSQGESTVGFENRYRCKDGSYRRLVWRASSDLKRGLIFASARDVTERQAMERELLKVSQQYRAVLDSTDFSIISTDAQGVIQTFNAAAQRNLGYTAEETIGKMTPSVFHDVAEILRHAEELSLELGRPIAPGLEAFTTKALLELPEDREWTYIRKDGTRFPARASMTALRDEERKVIGFLGVSRDITEHKRIERSHQDTQARLQAILDNTAAVIFMKDLEGRYLLINRRWADLFHVTTESIIGKTDFDVFRQEMAQVFRDNDLLVQKERKAMLLEEVAPHDDGLHTYVSVKFPVEDAEGNLHAIGGIATDITERKRAEEELRRSNQELEQFAYVASHDLQEPLRMITSYLQLLQKRYGEQLDAQAVQFVETAVAGARHMRALILDLLAVSRIGARASRMSATDCEKVLNAALETLRMVIEESGARITRDALPAVQANALQLGELFQNLIGNALKFRGKTPPEIHISARRDGAMWVFSVKDNGIGIDRKYFDRIFMIFQRLHTREEYQGTGIGLALCKKIVERHGGRIWVESQPENGATFFFTMRATHRPQALAR